MAKRDDDPEIIVGLRFRRSVFFAFLAGQADMSVMMPEQLPPQARKGIPKDHQRLLPAPKGASGMAVLRKLFLDAPNHSVTSKEMMAAFEQNGLNKYSASPQIAKLKNDGLVRSPEKGIWTATAAFLKQLKQENGHG